MPSTLVKGIIGLAGVTAVGGSATGIYYLTSDTKKDQTQKKFNVPTKKSISAWLTEKLNKSIISDSTNAKWTPKWNLFVAAYSTNEPTGKWLINDWATNKVDNKGIEQFKKLCKKNAQEEVNSDTDELFTKVKEYCVE